MRKHFLAVLLSLAGLCFPQSARAQFIGYTSPQTVNVQIFAGISASQTSAIGAIPNLGQSIHFITLRASSACNFRLTLEASNDGVNFFAIAPGVSDSGINAGLPSITGFFASGEFPILRLNYVRGNPCSGTFSAWYAGTSVANGSTGGVINASSPYRSVLALAPNSTLSLTTPATIYPPSANTNGTLWFQFQTNNCAGASLLVQAGPDVSHLSTLTTITPANVATLQSFTLPSVTASAMVFTYTACGTETYDTIAVFAGGLSNGADPCFSGAPKSSVPINLTTATTTQLVPLAAGKVVYVCGVSLTIAPSGTSADTIQFEYGTGASCGTGTTVLTGAFGAGDLTTTTGVTYVTFADPGTTFQTAVSNALCAVSAGTTVNIQGVLTDVQQ